MWDDLQQVSIGSSNFGALMEGDKSLPQPVMETIIHQSRNLK